MKFIFIIVKEIMVKCFDFFFGFVVNILFDFIIVFIFYLFN